MLKSDILWDNNAIEKANYTANLSRERNTQPVVPAP